MSQGSPRVLIPSISNLLPGFKFHSFPPLVAKLEEPVDSPNLEKKTTFSKTDFFSPEEDITLFKTVLMYFGQTSIETIPWSFWKFYRKATGSKRSDSSLYHHWNGSVQRKYGFLIKSGRISECIRSAEAMLDFKRMNEQKRAQNTESPSSQGPNSPNPVSNST